MPGFCCFEVYHAISHPAREREYHKVWLDRYRGPNENCSRNAQSSGHLESDGGDQLVQGGGD